MGEEVADACTDKQQHHTWGKSIPVESVQEIVKRDSSCVPDRYIRSQGDAYHNADKPHLLREIPIIDLSLLTGGCEFELKRLDLACQEWGFFQIINHSVEESVLQKMKADTAKFFELPLEEKKQYAMASDDIQGYGQAYVVSQDQKLDWADVLILVMYPSKYRKPKYWPTQPPKFKETTDVYSAEVNRVAKELLCSISLNMGLDKKVLLGMHKEVMQALRVNYYPTCCRPDQVLGVSPHSDTSTITILMQDDDITGLQIKHNDKWVPVKPIPNALVVNVGDVMEIWSNGKYKSIEHRAVINEKKARMSFATFVCPEDDVEMEPLDEMVDCEHHPRLYKKIKYGEYLRNSMKRKMDGKLHTQFAKLEG